MLPSLESAADQPKAPFMLPWVVSRRICWIQLGPLPEKTYAAPCPKVPMKREMGDACLDLNQAPFMRVPLLLS